MKPSPATSTRALAAGAVCLSILGGMMITHAWPLWTGQVVVLPVRPVDPRDLFRGEFVRLDNGISVIAVRENGSADAPGPLALPPAGHWTNERLNGQLVYVQLQPTEGTEHEAVSISREPVDGALNLRGRVVHSVDGGTIFRVDYGLDAFFMQEGTALPVEQAVRDGGRVQMEVVIASSGRARIRTLIVDGRRVR